MLTSLVPSIWKGMFPFFSNVAPVYNLFCYYHSHNQNACMSFVFEMIYIWYLLFNRRYRAREIERKRNIFKMLKSWAWFSKLCCLLLFRTIDGKWHSNNGKSSFDMGNNCRFVSITYNCFNNKAKVHHLIKAEHLYEEIPESSSLWSKFCINKMPRDHLNFL